MLHSRACVFPITPGLTLITTAATVYSTVFSSNVQFNLVQTFDCIQLECNANQLLSVTAKRQMMHNHCKISYQQKITCQQSGINDSTSPITMLTVSTEALSLTPLLTTRLTFKYTNAKLLQVRRYENGSQSSATRHVFSFKFLL